MAPDRLAKWAQVSSIGAAGPIDSNRTSLDGAAGMQQLIRPGRKRAVRRSVQERGAHILDAAAKLLDDHNIADLTMADIAKASGVPRQTLYKYFGSTTDIYRQVSRHLVEVSLDFTTGYVRARHPANIFEMIDLVIDGAISFLNAHSAARKTYMSQDAPFALQGWAHEYGKAAAQRFRSLVAVDWSVEPGTNEDPLYVVALMGISLLSADVGEHGRVTEACAAQVKAMSHAYLQTATALLERDTAQEGCARAAAERRWRLASERLLRVGSTAAIEFAARHTEQLLEFSAGASQDLTAENHSSPER